jgi:hypothetical protein
LKYRGCEKIKNKYLSPFKPEAANISRKGIQRV